MDGILFTRRLLDWYDAHRRDLPWRHAPEPYGVWVSEIMAQQTQMDRVVGYFERWMDRFPDIDTLARSREEDVLRLWEGLGYYSRAKNMIRAAETIVTEHGGRFPSDPASIRALPGVGGYTAGAISSIAFGLPEPAVDANVLRVFARLFDLDAPVRASSTRTFVEEKVRSFMPEGRTGDFTQALMELGALVCSRKPACGECPVRSLCAAFEGGTVALRPVLPVPKKTTRINMATGVLLHQGRMLIQKRRPDDVWPGLWEFPGGGIEAEETPGQAVVREYMEEVELAVEPVEDITTVNFSYTRYRVTMHCFLCRFAGEGGEPIFNEAVAGGFVSPGELAEYAFPAGHRKLIEFMKADRRFAPLFVES